MSTKPKSRRVATRAVNRGKLADRLHLVPATVVTCLKLARAERVYFAGRAITELAARCMLAEARRNRAAYARSRSDRGADYRWKWRPGGPGRKPAVVAREGLALLEVNAVTHGSEERP